MSASDPHPWVSLQVNLVRFGVATHPGDDWPALLSFVTEAEALGIDSFWVPDHPVSNPDCWTTLAALAVSTKTIRLGTSVVCVPYRNPVLVARAAADVDRLSGGRMVLGLGIGDDSSEFVQLGVAMTQTRERQALLAEAVTVISPLLRGDRISYEGRFLAANGARLKAASVQLPRVPLMIAGGGERTTLAQVARFADMSNFGGHPWTGGARTFSDIERKLHALRAHCEASRRPYETVLRSHMTIPLVLSETERAAQAKVERYFSQRTSHRGGLVWGTPKHAITYYRRLESLGIRYFVVAVRSGDFETLRLLGGEVLPALRQPGIS